MTWVQTISPETNCSVQGKKDWGHRTTFSEEYDGCKIVLTLEQWENSSLVTLTLEGLQYNALCPSQRSGTIL